VAPTLLARIVAVPRAVPDGAPELSVSMVRVRSLSDAIVPVFLSLRATRLMLRAPDWVNWTAIFVLPLVSLFRALSVSPVSL